MNRRAIKIDLSTFFDDERKMTCILLDTRWKTVECLQNRVKDLFDVESVRFLSDGYFLPPEESIEIIKLCNDIKAFVPKESLEKRKKKKHKKSKNVEKLLEEATRDDSQKKRKCNANLSNTAKRSKCGLIEEHQDGTIANEEITLSVKNSQLISSISKEPQEIETKASDSKISKNKANLERSTLVEQNIRKEQIRRNASTPKDKALSNVEEKTFDDEMKTTAASLSRIPSSTLLNESINSNCLTVSPNLNNPFKKTKTNKAHLYFDEAGEIASPSNKSSSKSKAKNDKENKEPKTIVIFRCLLSDNKFCAESKKPRIFNLKPKKLSSNAKTKQFVEIQEHILLPKYSIEKDSDNVLSNQNGVTNEVEKPQTIFTTTNQIVIAKDASKEQISFDNSTKTTNSDTTIKHFENEQASGNDLEVSFKNESQIETRMQKTNVNEASVMSVNCVDLSIDLDKDEEEVNTKNQKKKRNSKKRTKKKHDSTMDEDGNGIQEKLDLTGEDEEIKDLQENHNLTAKDEDDDMTNSMASDVEEVSEIIDLTESEDNSNTTLNNSNKDVKIKQILPFSVDLTTLPNVGHTIIFKVQKKNTTKEFVLTNFMAGKVEYINKRTKSIKFLIVDGMSELCHLPPNLVCCLDDSQNNDKYVQLKISEMFEPKLFSMS